MATTKISELPELTSPTAGLTDKFLLVTDSSSGIPLSKKMTFAKFDELLDTSSSTANLAFNHANSAFNSANAATLTDTTQNNSISSAFNHANAGFTSSNTYVTFNDSVNVTQNNSITAAFAAANAATLTDVTQNNSIVASFNHANAAFGVANSASGSSTDVYARNHSNSAFAHANAAFDVANTASGASTDVYARNHSNSAFIQANAAFTQANNANGNTAANLTLSFGATTILEVLNSGASAYIFTQYGALNNPNISTFSATTLGFKLNVSGHPFHIRTGDNTADYNTGLVHVSSNGTLSYDSAAQGKVDGTLFWRIPHNAIGTYRYRCANHPGAMIGYINVANTASIYFAYNT